MRKGWQFVALSKKKQPVTTVRVAGLLAIVIALYLLLQNFGVLNLLVPSQLASTSMSYGMLFVIGLLTSVHCVAMCGGINLSVCLPENEVPTEPKKRFAAFKPTFLYNLGRVVSYTLIGGLLGFAGLLFSGVFELGLPNMAQGVLKLIAGVFMVIMGINLLGIFPWMQALRPRFPKAFSQKVKKAKLGNKSPLIGGLLNGLMPCGPMQSIQIIALASANPLTGALSLFLFSMGTVPLILGLGSLVSALGAKFTQKAKIIGAVLVVVLGLAMLSQGSSLSGFLSPASLLGVILILSLLGIVSSIPFKKQSHRAASLVSSFGLAVALFATVQVVTLPASHPPEAATANQIVDGKQIINSTLSARSYPNITVEAGMPVAWTITAPGNSLNGCNYAINIGEYNIFDYTFKQGKNVIEFTPQKTGKFQYSCWMGMINGTITVVDSD